MLLGRTTDLHIYGPKGIKDLILLQLKLSGAYTSYQLYFHEIESKISEVVFEDDKVIVKTIPLQHRIYTNGYLFKEKIGDRKLNMSAVLNHNIDKCYYQKIKNGSDIEMENGDIIPNQTLTFDAEPTKSYAFCSDTKYNESIVPIIRKVDVLYHESTFLESEAEKAKLTMHCTAREAAQIAKLADVKQLILGHYSTRYESIALFKEEAETVFSNVLLGDDGKVFEF